jgi:parallel beta-helix repeat protein
VLAAGMLAVAPSGVSGASGLGLGGSLYVTPSGTDFGSCPQTAPCKTIDYAISQANPDATIHVAAGNYLQAVIVNKNVTINGAGTGTVIEPSTPTPAGNDPDSGYPTYADVNVTPGHIATVENLTVNGAPASAYFSQFGCAADFVGVYYHGASGKLSVVNVNDIELPTNLFGCQDGLGVYVDAPAGFTSNVNMSAVTVSNYDKNGITCDDASTSCVIAGSTVTGIGPTPLIAQNGIQAYNAKSTEISSTTVTENSYTGGGADNQATGLLVLDVGKLDAVHNTLSKNDINAYLGSDGTGPTEGSWILRYNSITEASDNVLHGEADYGDGIQIDSVTNSGLSVNQNTVTGSAENGISVLSSANVTVSDNTVEANADNGIYVGGPGFYSSRDSTSNKITDNKTFNNSQDGIVLAADTSGNTIRGNDSGGNGRFDIEDIFGVGNTFSQNTCSPPGDSNPGGLC